MVCCGCGSDGESPSSRNCPSNVAAVLEQNNQDLQAIKNWMGPLLVYCWLEFPGHEHDTFLRLLGGPACMTGRLTDGAAAPCQAQETTGCSIVCERIWRLIVFATSPPSSLPGRRPSAGVASLSPLWASCWVLGRSPARMRTENMRGPGGLQDVMREVCE